MKIGRRAIIVFGLVTSLLAAGAVPASAQVTPVDRTGGGKNTVTREADGEQVTRPRGPTSAVSVTAAAPMTSPAVYRYFTTDRHFFSCRTGYACAFVPYGDGKYVFEFYAYGTYTLYNWYGSGALYNTQTGGAAARVLGSGGGQLKCVRPGELAGVDWTPAYYVRLTPSGC